MVYVHRGFQLQARVLHSASDLQQGIMKESHVPACSPTVIFENSRHQPWFNSAVVETIRLKVTTLMQWLHKFMKLILMLLSTFTARVVICSALCDSEDSLDD